MTTVTLRDYQEKLIAEMMEYLSYDPNTGLFTRKKSRPGRMAKSGEVAGGKDKDGYIVIGFKGKKYKAHRLAFGFHSGIIVDSDHEVDHINLIKDDNRFHNLRIATKAENRWNRTVYNSSKSGIKGVYFNKRIKKWSGEVKCNGQRIFLGYSDNPDYISEKYRDVSFRLRGEFNRV